MRKMIGTLVAAAALLFTGPALADGPGTGRSWDDSHMRTRFGATPLPKTRPPIVIGDAKSEEVLTERTLPAATWRSWADGGKSIQFGKQAPRQTTGSGSLTGGRSGGGGAGGSLRGFGRSAAR